MIHKINRRQTLGILGAFALLSTASSIKATDYSDLYTDRYLGEVDVLATIEDDKVFTEGPAWEMGHCTLPMFRPEKSSNGMAENCRFIVKIATTPTACILTVQEISGLAKAEGEVYQESPS